MRITLFLLLGLSLTRMLPAQTPAVERWGRYEQSFTSARSYDNPLYDLSSFAVRFISPTGREVRVNGFWDGGDLWKVRFMPDEPGPWAWVSEASDTSNTGLHKRSGSFRCLQAAGEGALARSGRIEHPEGAYHLAHADGKPFFWAACTAWNGALKSTDEEWETYLTDRAGTGYSVVQFVTTPWRGGASDERGEVAFDGAGRIRINPTFFQRLDGKFDAVNHHGLVAAPVLLWALPRGQGRELSPGYYLPDAEAILLARYMVARYGAHHVVWILGGDGDYTGPFEQRWKTIGRGVFQGDPPGVVATHSMGRSWIGDIYTDEPWLDVIGYQSSHSNSAPVVEWITQGPMARQWSRLPPRPLINMEPNYEGHQDRITDRDVRNASYWSLFATPIAGITYGANGIWPWLRRSGEQMLNHGTGVNRHSWLESLSLPGSRQIGLLARFMGQFDWWTYRPAQDLLIEQPGSHAFNQFVSVVRADDHSVLAYLPAPLTVKLRNPFSRTFTVRWFDPVSGAHTEAGSAGPEAVLELTSPLDHDGVLILTRAN